MADRNPQTGLKSRNTAAGLGVGLIVAACASLLNAATWNVSAVWQLNNAVNNSHPGDEIVIAPGTYTLSSNLWMDTANITLRGATGNRDDVILRGQGMNTASGPYEGIQLVAPDITVRDLTVAEFYHHAIHFQSGAHRAHLYNVHTLNIGEHHMKGVRYCDGGLIEYCLMDQTYQRTNDGIARPDNYIGGIDLLGASNWTLRDNVARNIHGADYATGDPGIFLWQDITGCVIERNVVVGCNKGIALGNPHNPDLIVHAEDCIVRNNFITRGEDIGLELCFTKDCDAYNNTIYGPDGSYFRAVHIYDKAGRRTEDLELAYNLIRGRIYRNAGGTWTETGNIVGSTAAMSWFAEPGVGNLHLTELATGAIDHAATLAEVFEDVDTGPRPGLPDVGADEYFNPYPGDATRDGQVDYLDLGIVATHYGAAGPVGWDDGDFGKDFRVDYLDLGVVAFYYGSAAGGAPPVPEPALPALLSAAACALLRRRKR